MASLVITNAGIQKIATALVTGNKINILQFSTGFTAGTVDKSNTSVPAQNYGPVNITSVAVLNATTAQYECVIPESAGPFNINVLGLFDDTGTLFAIGQSSTTYAKVAQNLPTQLGNRFDFNAQIVIANLTAALNFTLNNTQLLNIQSLQTVDLLSLLAVTGTYKNNRIITMPDGQADIASTNGVNWSFGRYINEFSGTSSRDSSTTTRLKGDGNKPWQLNHIGSVVEITSGPLINYVRPITGIDTVNNEAIVAPAFPSTALQGAIFLVSSPLMKNTFGTLPYYSQTTGRLLSDNNLFWDPTYKRLSVNDPAAAYSLSTLGGGVKFSGLATPQAPTVSVFGAQGTTLYQYYIIAVDYEGYRSNVSLVGQTLVGFDTLDNNNYNQITWPAVPGAKSYIILKSNLNNFIGTSTTTSFNDIGQAVSAYSPPTRNETADVFLDGRLLPKQEIFLPNTVAIYGTRKDGSIADPLIYMDASNVVQIPGVIAPLTKMIFSQALAPTGWTRDQTQQDDSVLRYRSSAAPTFGGSWTITGVTVQGHAITIAELPAHSHNVNDPSHSHIQIGGDGAGSPSRLRFQGDGDPFNANFPSQGAYTGITINSTGGSQAHVHGLSADGTWRPRYIDVIVCIKS